MRIRAHSAAGMSPGERERADGGPEGVFIGDGERVVRKMLAFGNVDRVLCAPHWLEKIDFPSGLDVRVAPLEVLNQLVGYRLHSAVMAMGRIPPERPVSGTLHVALDGLSNVENVGAILRVCAAFGVDGVIVGPNTASPWHRRAIRVSMGAPLAVPVHVVPDLAAACRVRNAWAAHIHGEHRLYREVDYRAPVWLVLGAEDDGVSPEVLEACRGTVFIPMAPEWDCLNVVTSAAVLLAEVQRQRSAPD